MSRSRRRNPPKGGEPVLLRLGRRRRRFADRLAIKNGGDPVSDHGYLNDDIWKGKLLVEDPAWIRK